MSIDSVANLKIENAKLQEELAFTRSLLDSANSIVIRWDKNGAIQFMNDFGLRFFGYSSEELFGQQLIAIVPRVEKSSGRDMAELTKKISETPEKYTNVSNENITKDGRIVWVTWTNKGIYDEQGNVQEILAIGNDITDFKRSEEKKKQAYDLLGNAEKVANIGSWEWDILKDTFVMSDQWLQIHGIQNRNLAMADLIKIAHPDDVDEIKSSFGDALKGDRPYEITHRIIRQDNGEIRVIFAKGIVIHDNDGKPVLVRGVAQDITERKQIEDMLLNEKAFLRSLIDSADDIIYFKDLNGLYLGCNKASERFLKITEDEQIGKSDFDFFERGLAEKIVKDDQKVLTTAETIRTEEWVNTPGSLPCIMETVKAPIFGVDGKPIGLVGVSRNVTEKKWSEEALKKRNKDLQLAQRLAKVGNWTLDPEVGVAEWSDEIYRILERNPVAGPYSLAEYKNLFKGEWFEKFNSAIQRAIHEGQPYDHELKIEFASDHVKWVRAICEPEPKSGSNKYFLRGTVQDITERKQAEHERQDLESQLRQKYKMEAVGIMAGGMAHNFNNNLAIILGNLELSKRKLSPQSEIGEYLDYANIAAVRSRDLVKQIMTYSRKGVQPQVPLQLSLLLKEILSLLKSTIPSSVKLRQKINPECEKTYIQADASQLQECLLNLCNNAVHAMEEQGELLLTLERGQLNQEDISPRFNCSPGEYLCLSVQDTGSGIPTDIQEKIFDPFFTTKEPYQGTGMGLSTVQGAVEQHRGMITVESCVGEGATFTLYFPVADQHQKEEVVVQDVELQKGTEKILLVDDDEMVANLNEQMLSEMGYQVTVQTDGVEALELFSANVNSYDLIMTDQTMPGLTGKELIQKIKMLRPEIPTILCTGYSNKVNEEEARQAGISAFLMKPTEITELSQVIRTVLEKTTEP